MITLAQDCLLFHLENGEQVPFSAEMISVELVGESSRWIDPEMAGHAAKAVFHYFKAELKRQSVTAAEFSSAMEKVLRGLKLSHVDQPEEECRIIESDLWRLAREAAPGCELVFFSRLRSELRQQLRERPRLLRFRGLRACVKEMARAQRWSTRCRKLEEQIVSYLRECAGAEIRQGDLAFIVE